MLNLRYNLNGNSPEDLMTQLDVIWRAARALDVALSGDMSNGRNYQSLPDAETGRIQDYYTIRNWRNWATSIEEQVEATMVELLNDDRVRKAWNKLQAGEGV